MKKNPSELLNLLFISTLIVPTIKNDAYTKINEITNDSNKQAISLLFDESKEKKEKGFEVIINNKIIPSSEKKITLKKDKKIEFKINDGPSWGTHFFFCEEEKSECKLYPLTEAGHAEFYFTPTSDKEISYKLGFCSQDNCEKRVYKIITIKSEK